MTLASLLNLESITLFSISLQNGHFIPHALPIRDPVTKWIHRTLVGTQRLLKNEHPAVRPGTPRVGKRGMADAM
jgi:hypothetical protein